MRKRTYYDILGVSADATLEEITGAKNALAKVYHPDVNIKNNIDTTAYMQEILEAYRVLSNPEKRRKYDIRLSGKRERIFRTYTLKQSEEDNVCSFVTYWNAAYKLNEIVESSSALLKKSSALETLPSKILRIHSRSRRTEPKLEERLNALCASAINYIAVLKSAQIPMIYWQLDAMNWVLVRWGQKKSIDYHVLFSKYDDFIENNKNTAEKLKLRNQFRHFQSDLKRLLEYTI